MQTGADRLLTAKVERANPYARTYISLSIYEVISSASFPPGTNSAGGSHSSGGNFKIFDNTLQAAMTAIYKMRIECGFLRCGNRADTQRLSYDF